MKIFFSEFKADYEKYHFPYQVWLLKEDGDDTEEIYGRGFLPIRNIKDVYYLSRNIRVDLNIFELSSENKRILKKTEDFSSELISLSKFKYTFEVQKFCKQYIEQRFGKGFLTTTGIKNIFSGLIFTHVLVFISLSTNRVVGYAVCRLLENLLQYGHSFYDLNYFKENLGARMMLETVIRGKNDGKKFVYLGTCYDQGALYKTEFKGVQFFNGFAWSTNLEELKTLVGQEEKGYLLKNKDYLNSFYKGDLLNVLNNFGVRIKF